MKHVGCPVAANLAIGAIPQQAVIPNLAGEMAEWLKAHAWKACLLERVTWVRPNQWNQCLAWITLRPEILRRVNTQSKDFFSSGHENANKRYSDVLFSASHGSGGLDRAS